MSESIGWIFEIAEKFWKYGLNFIYDIQFRFKQRELFGRRQLDNCIKIINEHIKLKNNSLYFEKRLIWHTS